MGKTLADLVTMTQQHLDNSLGRSTSTSYNNFSQFLTYVKAELREALQKLTAAPVRTIISKLKQKKPLTDSEIGLLRLWIVGDAEAYVMTENNYNEWIDEMKRLVREIQQYKDQTPELDTVVALQGRVVDLHRNLQDIINFLSEKERVDRFIHSTQQIDSEEAHALAAMLERKLQSSEM